MKKLTFSLLLFGLCVTSMAQTLSSLEAVEYDALYNRFLIANGSDILSRAANGDLTYFNDDASVQYGMEIIGGTLFAIQSGAIERVRAFNIETGEELFVVNVAEASFLNGMATDGVSRIWATDFSNGSLYEFDMSDFGNPTYEMVIEDTGTTPNGIVFDQANNRLVMANWYANAPIIAIDPDTYEMTTLITTDLGSIDGIDNDSYGNFYVSSWSPTRITRYNNDFSSSEIITVPGLSSPADISYAWETDTLAIPNSGNNTMIYVGFDFTDDVRETGAEMNFMVYPNPATESSRVMFELPSSGAVTVRLIDAAGKSHATLIDNENLIAGKHHIVMAGTELKKGYYLCELQAIGSVLHFPFLVE